MSKVDFVIATRNLRLASRCIASIQESCADYLGSIIVVMRPEVQFTTAADQGWRASREEYVCFVNDDAFPTRDALEKMLYALRYEDNCGAAGPCIPCRTHQGSAIPTDKRMNIDVPFLVAGCLLTKRSILEEVGGWDTKYILYAGDIDLSFRIRDAGYRLLWVRDAWVNHIVGSSSELVAEKADLDRMDHARLDKKFPGRLREYQKIPTEPVNERPIPGADGWANQRYEMAKATFPKIPCRVLDVGCGNGTGARVYADCEYVGIELDGGALSFARAHYPGTFVQGYVDREPYGLGVFDHVVACEIIEHVQDPNKMLQNIADSMKDEATLTCSTPVRQGVFNPYHLQEWLPEELEALLRHYFEDVSVEVKDFGFLAPTIWSVCKKPRRLSVNGHEPVKVVVARGAA